ncbi:hypothetical protein BOO33_18345 [Vibrio navarrensis]|nr:hypothetical protein [Vibrio navarrensis]
MLRNMQPKRLCAKLADLTQSQYSIEAIAQKLALLNNADLPENLNELPKEERIDRNQLILFALS